MGVQWTLFTGNNSLSDYQDRIIQVGQFLQSWNMPNRHCRFQITIDDRAAFLSWRCRTFGYRTMCHIWPGAAVDERHRNDWSRLHDHSMFTALFLLWPYTLFMIFLRESQIIGGKNNRFFFIGLKQDIEDIQCVSDILTQIAVLDWRSGAHDRVQMSRSRSIGLVVIAGDQCLPASRMFTAVDCSNCKRTL